MASTINTNINSLNAQRSLSMSQASLTTSMQRLSSGLRINSAKDDAAGLAISDRMTAQIRGLTQAARNANDGISLAQTAEGALGEVTANLQRIRELAVQSANSTNTSSDRASLDLEVQQRLAEIDRVTSQTSFNGQKLLDGSFGNAKFQVGASVGETISIDLTKSMRTSNLGLRADYAGGATYDGTLGIGQQGAGVGIAAAPVAGDLTIAVGNGATVSIAAPVAGTGNGQTATSAYAKALAINNSGIAGLKVEAQTQVTMGYVTNAGAFTLAINGSTIVNAAAAGLTGDSLATTINQFSGSTGVTASFASGRMTLTAADGRDINMTQTDATAAEGFMGTIGTNNSTNVTLAPAATQLTTATAFQFTGSIRLSSTERIVIGEANSGAAKFGLSVGALALGASALNSAAVTSISNANSAIDAVDSALTGVSTLRSTFGAMQNRFDSVIANLGSSVENLSASRSRIQDADFAQETANLSRSQILQQAGTAMVAQANQLPQGVLALLR
jgi:flagellin